MAYGKRFCTLMSRDLIGCIMLSSNLILTSSISLFHSSSCSWVMSGASGLNEWRYGQFNLGQHSKTRRGKMMRAIYFLAISIALCGSAWAQSSEGDLKSYVPVLPIVKAQFFKIDPKLGYAVKDMGGGVYVISDNGWQSAFLVTDDGVIVFDAPESFGKSIPSAIANVTDKPIKMLIYSHIHKDHIGGSAAFKNISGLKIVALNSAAEFLKEQ